jgi:hypothetical protein
VSALFTEDRVECARGWAQLYRPIIQYAELCAFPVIQVKEKFGGLRIYIDYDLACTEAEMLRTLCDFAEGLSYHTCEQCGKTMDVSTISHRGWLKTLCETHHREIQEQLNAR